jgi:hypothetical protein
MPNSIIAILAAGVAGWVAGAIWYGILGKPWQRAQGLDPDACKDKKMPLNLMLVTFLAALVMSAVVYHFVTGLGVFFGVTPTGIASTALPGLVLGIGLVWPAILVNNLFQNRSFTLTVIDGGHWTVALAVESIVVSLLA